MLEHSFLMKIDLPIIIYVLSKEEYIGKTGITKFSNITKWPFQS